MDLRCLPCLVSQALKVARLTHAPDAEGLIREVFACLAQLDYAQSNPEILGRVFGLIKRHTGAADPYRATRLYYDELMLGMEEKLRRRVERAEDSFYEALKLAVAGNVIDFGPAHELETGDVLKLLDELPGRSLMRDDSAALRRDILGARRLLYIGDNCGEICLDKLLIEQIKRLNPALDVVFGVRGEPIVNDALMEDALRVGMDRLVRVIDNGDGSQGTVLGRVSEEFMRHYRAADVIIAKGQANFESLADAPGNLYFMMMVKCAVMAEVSGAAQGGLVCLNRRAPAC